LSHEQSYSTLGWVSTGMSDHLWAGILPLYVTNYVNSPCIFLGLLNRVLALFGWDKGGMSPLLGAGNIV